MKDPRQLKITLVTPQLPVVYRNGGIGTFCLHFLRLLRQNGYENITVIYTSHLETPPSVWKPFYAEMGITLDTIQGYHTPFSIPLGYDPFTYISELADQKIPDDSDVIYFADFRANGLIPVRRRRYSQKTEARIVTIIHGPSAWHREGQHLWPVTEDDIRQDYNERYVAEHSDIVAAPSQYALDWARSAGWKLPPEDRCFALGYPWLPDESYETEARQAPAPCFKRLIYFGRVETRKGFDIVIEGLAHFAETDEGARLLDDLDELVILGQEGVHGYGTVDNAIQRLQLVTDLPVTPILDKNTFEAQSYLRDHVADSLVLLPSRAETFGFTLVEASRIPGLNVIASDAGGLIEVLGEAGAGQYFNPTVKSFQKKLREWLKEGPRSHDNLAHYDWQSFNQRWLDFHEHVSREAMNCKSKPVLQTKVREQSHEKSVDIILTHYNLGQYLPYAIESLSQQSTDDFNLYVLDDGSTDEESVAIFEKLAMQYESEHWHFLRKCNGGVCRTRNIGAALGSAEYIIFMDADNVASPQMVERFRDCIMQSGDDLLTAWQYTFEGEGSPFLGTRTVPIPPRAFYIPDGNYPVLNLLSEPFGDINCIMRRSSFEAIGGFTTDTATYINHEDRELFTRFSLEGYKMDVIPEFLYYYRYREDSRLRTSQDYLNDLRVLRNYQDKMRDVGLEYVIPLLTGLRYSLRDQNFALSHIFRNPDGTVFYTQQDYLRDGVSWWTLLQAFKDKLLKRLKRR